MGCFMPTRKVLLVFTISWTDNASNENTSMYHPVRLTGIALVLSLHHVAREWWHFELAEAHGVLFGGIASPMLWLLAATFKLKNIFVGNLCRLVQARSFFALLAPVHDQYMDAITLFANTLLNAGDTDEDEDGGHDAGDDSSEADDDEGQEAAQSDSDDDDSAEEDAAPLSRTSKKTRLPASYSEPTFQQAKVKRKELAATARKKKKKRQRDALGMITR